MMSSSLAKLGTLLLAWSVMKLMSISCVTRGFASDVHPALCPNKIITGWQVKDRIGHLDTRHLADYSLVSWCGSSVAWR